MKTETPDSRPEENKVLVIAGPTASGKTSLALDIAEKYSGIIINADSQQVYADLAVITARPEPDELARAPHRLFGVLGVNEVCSAGRWLEMAKAEIRLAWQTGLLPVVVGGTGMYISALTEGLSPIPDVSPAVRREVRAIVKRGGAGAVLEQLENLDPQSAARINPADSQRLARALEVCISSGRPFSHWRDMPREGRLEGAGFATIVLLPPREELYARIDARFEKMAENGAIEEVKNLLGQNLDPGLPAMKALGVPELAAYLGGEITMDEAMEKAKQASRNYAKRQVTWARHRFVGDVLRIEQYSESSRPEIFSFIDHFLLTEKG